MPVFTPRYCAATVAPSPEARGREAALIKPMYLLKSSLFRSYWTIWKANISNTSSKNKQLFLWITTQRDQNKPQSTGFFFLPKTTCVLCNSSLEISQVPGIQQHCHSCGDPEHCPMWAGNHLPGTPNLDICVKQKRWVGSHNPANKGHKICVIIPSKSRTNACLLLSSDNYFRYSEVFLCYPTLVIFTSFNIVLCINLLFFFFWSCLNFWL